MGRVIYVAMDGHLKSIAVVWAQAKEKQRCLVVGNTAEGWEKLVRAVGAGEIWGVYEASSCGFEVYDHFTKIGWKMSVVAPTHIPKSAHGRKRKTDLRDAKSLWDVLVAHGELGTNLPEVWIPTQRLRVERELVRRRLALAEHLTRVKNSIHGLLRMHKLKRPADLKSLWTQKYVAWLKGLASSEKAGAHLRSVLGSYLRELDFLLAYSGPQWDPLYANALVVRADPLPQDQRLAFDRGGTSEFSLLLTKNDQCQNMGNGDDLTVSAPTWP